MEIRRRELTKTDVVPAMSSLAAAAVSVLILVAAYVALLVTAAVAAPVGFAASSVAVTAAEVGVHRRQPIIPWALRRVEFGGLARGLARGFALVVFAARATTTPTFVATLTVVAVITLAAIARVGGAELHDFVRIPAAVSRGLALSRSFPPPPPPAMLVRPGGWAAVSELIAAIGLALSVHHGAGGAFAALGAAAVLALSAPVAVAADLIRLGGLRFRSLWTRTVWQAIGDYDPEIVAYLGNGVEWLYQLEMWLDVLESLPHRVLLVVRDVDALRSLSPTTLPVVCVPRAVALMQMPLPPVKAVLYVGNAANNVHFLRRRGTRTVFIGHGDSDKGASSNPFTRVYDEVWVAGQAGRDRYREAGVDIPDRAFANVGRPQLPELPRSPDRRSMFTVLYAPTWEGWDDLDEADTSVAAVGPQLIRALLATSGVRVMYRPHPQTGYRDLAVRRAHNEILEILRAAGAETASVREAPTGAVARLTPTANLLAAEVPRSSAREMRLVHDAAVRRWADRYWSEATGHRILTQPAPDLQDCFQFADLLIADISSVVAEWLAADRPYAVVNMTSLPADEFRARSGSASGGYVLSPDLAELGDILDTSLRGEDPTELARGRARAYLLGPRTADPAETFRRNIDRLCATD